MKRPLYIGSLLACLAPTLSAQNTVNERPNIIFILADDLGWSDLGVMGSESYQTPNIDHLASQGLLFTNAYAAASNSAPSRACIMSGMYPPRHGIYTVSPPDRGDKTKRKLIPIENKEELDRSFTTVAEALSACGYQCGIFGKWHLGDINNATDPLSRGFVRNIGGGHQGSTNSHFYPYCNENGSNCLPGLENGEKGEFLADRLTTEAIRFIGENKDKPFFLYLPHYSVHVPIQAPQSYIDRYKGTIKGKHQTNERYAAMMANLDWNVGRVMHAVDSLGIDKQTIIIFYSDNGGSIPQTDNFPLRDGKGSPHEGGIRVPLIIKWPGKIQEGSKTDVPVTGVDFYPTFVNIAQGKVAQNLDGKDIFQLLNGHIKRDLFWHFPAYLESYISPSSFRARPYSIIRSGDWKLIYYYEDKSMELFNMKNDWVEHHNVINAYPTIRKELYKKLMKWIKETKAPIPTEPNPYFVSEK